MNVFFCVKKNKRITFEKTKQWLRDCAEENKFYSYLSTIIKNFYTFNKDTQLTQGLFGNSLFQFSR